MTKNRFTHWVKGVVVSAVAANACYWLWTVAREGATTARAAKPDVALAGLYSAMPHRLTRSARQAGPSTLSPVDS